jgi:hypothetical protein
MSFRSKTRPEDARSSGDEYPENMLGNGRREDTEAVPDVAFTDTPGGLFTMK